MDEETLDDCYLRNPKKQKVILTGDEDYRISQLSDSLLVLILSSLPTKDVFTTCILSKRWKNLWTSIDSFIFSPGRSIGEYNGFRSFVDYVLSGSVSSKIKKFEINCYGLYKYKSQINRWLSFAVRKNVEDVIIYSDPISQFSESFFTCSSLITLHLVRSSLVSDFVIAWKSLKSITLENMVVVDAQIVNLLSGCPALETILFQKVGGFGRLEINSLKVKRLKLKGCWFYDGRSGNDHFFEIFAPYLQHLELSHDFHDFRCSLLDVSSLVNAKITFNITCIKELRDILYEDFDEDSDEDEADSDEEEDDYHQRFKSLFQDYLQKLNRTTELTFGTLFTQVLCILQFKEVPIPELECKHLVLELHLEKFNLYGAAGLLRALPLAETLNIEIENQPSYISNFVLPNLKNVKIVISSGMCMKKHKWEYIKKLFKLSDFLLENAVVLEKFIIVSNRRRCDICGIKCVSRFLSRLANKLRSYADSVIIFQELVDVSSTVKDLQDNPDEDSDDEEDSCSDYYQDSDDEEDSCSDYYQDSDDEDDNSDQDSD